MVSDAPSPVPTRLAFVDATAGVAGDMLLGALLDAGADLAGVQRVLDALIPGSVRLSTATVDRQGQRATQLEVEVLVADPPHCRWSEIREALESARDSGTVPARTVDLALGVFTRLAEAEAAAHGVPAEEIHFHEVGALDSIADVVGTCEAWRQLGIASAVGSTIAVGSGRIRAAHGDIPVPVPAVVRLATGWPTVAGEILPPRGHAPAHSHSDSAAHSHPAPSGGAFSPHDHDHDQRPPHTEGGPHEQGGRRVPEGVAPGIGELATPTGVALVRGLAERHGPQPALVTEALGVGAGSKDTPGRANVVRVLIGQPADPSQASAPTSDGRPAELGNKAPGDPDAEGTREPAPTPEAHRTSEPALAPDAHDTPATAIQLEANVDDLDPRLWPGVITSLLDAGALDAWLTPIVMKHGRPAVTIHALSREDDHDALAALIHEGTGTLGVRRHRVERSIRHRSFTEVTVDGERIAVKLAHDEHGTPVRAEPEFRDVAAAARALRRSEREVLARAQAEALRLLDGPWS